MPTYPNPPIAYAAGHSRDCFLADGTYLRCVSGCRAQATWSEQMDASYARRQPDLEKFRRELDAEHPAPPSPSTGQEKP